MVLDERLGVDQVQQLQRSPVSDVYAQIGQDFNFASSILEPASTIKGKATKGAALALLGKAYCINKNGVMQYLPSTKL